MTPEAFLQFAEPLPEPMLLLTGDGQVRAANRAVEDRLGMARQDVVGRHLNEFASDPAEQTARYLRACSRTRSMNLGALTLRVQGNDELKCRAEGALIAPKSGHHPAVLLLRLIPNASAVGQFIALNLRITDLGKEVQRRKQAEEDARQEEERLRVTLHSIGDAVIVTDPQGAVVAMNPVAESMTGWAFEEAAGRPLGETFQIVNEATRTAVENPALRALHEGAIVGLANHTLLVARDGTERPIDDSAAPIRTAQNQLIGAVLVFRDITERRKAEAALRTSEVLFRDLANSLPQIVWAAGADGRIDYFNERWYEYTGFDRDFNGLQAWESLLHPEDVGHYLETYAQAIRHGRSFRSEFRFLNRAQNQYRWFLGRAVPSPSANGQTMRWFGTFTEIDETKRSEQNSRFLAEASAALAHLNDPDSTLQQVASIAVPTFADWCLVDLLNEDGSRQRVAVAHADPTKASRLLELSRRYPPRPLDRSGPGHAILSGEAELVEQIPDSTLSQIAQDAEHLRYLQELGLKSYISAPLKVRDRLLGLITFATEESSRRFESRDLMAAKELASRAAVAIENANLYRKARDEDRRKNEFLATLAHELRNPLAPIRMGLELLKVAKDDVRAMEEARGMMDRQLGQMVHIIDDLLDVSRISRGKLELRKEPVALAEIVRSAMETCDPIVKQGGHALSLSLADEPLYADADKTRLAQALCNLLSNAAKYTPATGQIWLKMERQGTEAVISVKDTGIGIPPEMQTKVFDLFTQVDQSLEKSQGGLGIGLSIAKRLVEMHHGRISVHSEGHGRGSEFVVHLPLIRDRPNERSPSGDSEGRVASLHRRILVVDDNADAAASLTMLLRLKGHDVRTAHDGLQAIESAASFLPELILMDIGMPRLNGYETCRRIRSQPWGKDVIIVAVTGWGQAEDRVRSAQSGFDHHLVKPIEPAAVEKILQTRGLPA